MLTTLSVLILASVLWYLSALPQNFKNARRVGLPIYISPISPNNFAWLFIAGILGYSSVARILPSFILEMIKLTIPGWEYHTKYSVHDQRGAAFVLVSPGVNTIVIADPEMAYNVLARRKGFGRVDLASKTATSKAFVDVD